MPTQPRLYPPTPRQSELLDYLIAYSEKTGGAPSYHEIRTHMGLKSLSTVHGHVMAMQKRGIVTAIAGHARTIPAAVMLAGGPPYKLTFTEACLREIMESQK